MGRFMLSSVVHSVHLDAVSIDVEIVPRRQLANGDRGGSNILVTLGEKAA
jgi:hypothetical protein